MPFEVVEKSGSSVELSGGQTVWVRGRQAIFHYPWQGGAVVRYQGEKAARVVPVYRIATTPPETL